VSAQPLRFLGVGICGYAVNLAAFAALYGAAGNPYAAAAVLSYVGSNAFMYVGNRYFTFGLGHRGFLGAYLRYVLVGILIAVINVAVLSALVEVAGLGPRLGLAVSLLLVTPIAFVLFKRWTFRITTA
jgi:putative flippase GtrA